MLNPKQAAAMRHKDQKMGGNPLPALNQKLMHNAPMAGMPAKHPTAPPIASPMLANQMARMSRPPVGLMPRA